jgi:triphosphatase
MPETELKFLAAEADLAKLWTLPTLRRWIRDARTQQIRTVYFDTSDRDLWSRGFVLRIRDSGGRLILTVKQEQPSLVERGEWEFEIARPRKGAPLHPDLAVIEGTPLAGAIDETIRACLRPAFEIKVERTTFLCMAGETGIEVAIDRGAICELAADGQTLPISELELELKQGDRRAAFALGRTLAAQAPLQLSLISKAERGQLLIAGAAHLPAKGSRPRFGDEMTADAAFVAICHACLHDLMLNVAALDGDDPVEAVHLARVALRRLRAALALFRPIRRDGFAKMNNQLKWIADIFGVARDCDILHLRDAAPAAGAADCLATDFSRWRDARRLSAHQAIRAAVQSKRWRIFLIDLCEWIEEAGAPALTDHREGARFVRKRLSKRRDDLLKPPRDLSRLDPDTRHKLRIKAKKLRYMAQFFSGVPRIADPADLKRLLARLDKLQAALGDMHDEEARRGVVEAEMSLWRSGARPIEAPSIAPPEPVALSDAYGQNLDKAMKAYAGLIKINPF